MMINKLKVNLVDDSFSMCGPSCGTGETGTEPFYLEWVREKNNLISVFTDLHFDDDISQYGSKYNIAWIIEPRVIDNSPYINLRPYEKFDMVFTHDAELISVDKKFVFVPLGGHWILDEDCGVYPKSDNLSIIASSKNNTVGHGIRHQVISSFNKHFNGIFGTGYNRIKYKLDGMKNYRFHVVIENAKNDYWFTEKLIDALLTGCVPIYYGAPSIGNFFDERGILCFNSLEEFSNILTSKVNENFYQSLLDLGVIQNNFIKAHDFLTPEDYMYLNVLRFL